MAMIASVIAATSGPAGVIRSTTAVAWKHGVPTLSCVTSLTSVSMASGCLERSTKRRSASSG
jgi:hypothetical protein